MAVIKEKQTGKPQHTEAHHAHSHHRAAAKGDVQRGGEARARGVRGADVGLGGHFHSDIAGERGARGSHHKGKRDERARVAALRCQGQQYCHADDKPRQLGIFSAQKRHRPIGDVAGDAFHTVGARVLPRHPLGTIISEDQSQ